MSIEIDLRAALCAHEPLTDLVGTRIAMSYMDPTRPRPFVVFDVGHQVEFGLAGNDLGRICTADLQCWADTAAVAAATADAVISALPVHWAPIGVAHGYDPEANLCSAIVTASAAFG